MVLELIAAMALVVGGCREIVLPPIMDRSDCRPVKVSVLFQRCTFGHRSLTTNINRLIEQQVRESAGYDYPREPAIGCEEDEITRENDLESWCEQPFRAGDLVSISCGTAWTGGNRGGAQTWAINLKVTGGQFREIKLADLFLGKTAEAKFWEFVRADIERQLRAVLPGFPAVTEEMSWMVDNLKVANEQYVSFHLSETGVVVNYSYSSYRYAILDSRIPFQALKGILRPEISGKGR